MDERKAIVHLPDGNLQCMKCETIWPNEYAAQLEAEVERLREAAERSLKFIKSGQGHRATAGLTAALAPREADDG